MRLSPILLIGSVPLPNARDVFEFLGRNLGDMCGQYPDGETGDRINWVRWQVHVFADNPDLELVEAKNLPGFKDTIKRPFSA